MADFDDTEYNEDNNMEETKQGDNHNHNNANPSSNDDQT